MSSVHDKALAALGLISYRCKSQYGWIMIGARDDDDAYSEALRSSSVARREDFEVWDSKAECYVAAGKREAA
jgi:hypothetical protein